MSQKSKFQEWLESDSYKHFVFDEGTVTHTTFIKVAKNDDFDYLFSQTFYSGSHIQRDDHLYFSGMYCKRDGKVYCAYTRTAELKKLRCYTPLRFMIIRVNQILSKGLSGALTKNKPMPSLSVL